MNYLLVFVGGGLGAEARYWLQGLVYRLTGPGFPYGTFVVNVVGSLVIGVLVPIFEERFAVNPEVRIFLIVGILGGFTTFSSFSYETLALLREGSALTALLNVCATVAICLGATWLGMILGELI